MRTAASMFVFIVGRGEGGRGKAVFISDFVFEFLHCAVPIVSSGTTHSWGLRLYLHRA
jgi:hypothetical protein